MSVYCVHIRLIITTCKGFRLWLFSSWPSKADDCTSTHSNSHSRTVHSMLLPVQPSHQSTLAPDLPLNSILGPWGAHSSLE